MADQFMIEQIEQYLLNGQRCPVCDKELLFDLTGFDPLFLDEFKIVN